MLGIFLEQTFHHFSHMITFLGRSSEIWSLFGELCFIEVAQEFFFFSSNKTHILSLASLVFITYLCNMDITTTNKMLLQVISDIQSKNKGQCLDNIRYFCELTSIHKNALYELTNYWRLVSMSPYYGKWLAMEKIPTELWHAILKTLNWITSRFYRAMNT